MQGIELRTEAQNGLLARAIADWYQNDNSSAGHSGDGPYEADFSRRSLAFSMQCVSFMS